MFDLYDKLRFYDSENKVPMHMPGHKRNQQLCRMENPYAIDITEIDGFDNLHHATGILEEAQRQAAQMYGAQKSFFLINGSSAGMLAAVSAAARQDKRKIWVARNCHKSVYNALYLNDLTPVYLFPDFDEKTGIWGKIGLLEVKEALERERDGCAVVITSPTYEGNVSDISELAEAVHARGVPLIVDSAHGAHFHFHDAFPHDALSQGADVVVESLHKTLPAMTQTAILHVNHKSLIAPEQIFFYLDMFQSTSPSYVLLASIEQCLAFVRENKQAFQEYVDALKKLRGEIGKLENIGLISADDISKLVLYSPYLKGQEIYDILLKDYGIQMEMASLQYALAMTSVCDIPAYYQRFMEALKQLDTRLKSAACEVGINITPAGTAHKSGTDTQLTGVPHRAEMNISLAGVARPGVRLSMRQAMKSQSVFVPFSEAAGRISAGFVFAYPPGSPLVAPGEEIDDKLVEKIQAYIAQGIEIVGPNQGMLPVCI